MGKEPVVKQEDGTMDTDAIVATLLVSGEQSPTGGQEELTDEQKLAAEAETKAAEEEAAEGDADEESGEGGEEEQTSDDDAEDAEEEDEGEDDETAYLDVTDDDLITVMVDDEEQEVSIGDLRKAYSGEGAIEKRLQEATEERKAAVSLKVRSLEALAAQEQVLLTSLEGLDDTLFAGVIGPPSEATKQSDPELYVRHLEAYEEDQKRINAAKAVINKAKEDALKQRQERLAEFAQQSGQIIAQQIPELADKNETVRTAMFNKLAQTAISYGYSQEEINAALDPRMFVLVRDAMKFKELSGKAKERDPKDVSGQQKKRVRRLRSGNTSAKTRARQADNQRKTAVERAKKTGKVDDVLATIIS